MPPWPSARPRPSLPPSRSGSRSTTVRLGGARTRSRCQCVRGFCGDGAMTAAGAGQDPPPRARTPTRRSLWVHGDRASRVRGQRAPPGPHRRAKVKRTCARAFGSAKPIGLSTAGVCSTRVTARRRRPRHNPVAPARAILTPQRGRTMSCSSFGVIGGLSGRPDRARGGRVGRQPLQHPFFWWRLHRRRARSRPRGQERGVVDS